MSSQTAEQAPSDHETRSVLGATAVRLGAAMLEGLNTVQESTLLEPHNRFAPELSKEPVLRISEIKGSEGIFNVTVLDIQGRTFLFGRQVQEAAPTGQPDTGPLVMAELGGDYNIISSKEIWKPDGKSELIEDPRAYQASNGKTIIGITVVRTAEGNKTYPGIIDLESPEQLLSSRFPDLRIIEKFGGGSQATPTGGLVEGKNATLIDDKNIMYRPEGMNHALQVLDCTSDIASHVGFIDFPKNIPWAQYKIGTTTPPEWLNDNEALFIFHGINIVNGIFEYAIGTSRLLREVNENGEASFKVDNISPSAMILPSSFPGLTDGRAVELHPELRRALYNCGAMSKRNAEDELVRIELFPNQGDKRTWRAEVAADEIIANWDRT